MKNFLLVAIIFLIATVYLSAQSDSPDLKKFPAQVSFIYPMGSHGINSGDYEYLFSLNALSGRTGAVDGVEIAGLTNLNHQDLKGFQIGGIGNIVGGNVDGFQVGGIFNLVGHDFTGFQVGGIISINGGYTRAGQISGIGGVANGVYGAQISGIVSISSDSVTGLQIGGITNGASSVNGVQIAGISNAARDVDGLQLAGIVNIAENVTGAQIAGILNICDSIDGIPIALFSFIRKNGYRKLEISTSEFEWAKITYKTGVRKFYTMFSLGYQGDSPAYNITFGTGVGTSFLLKNQKSAIDIEWRLNQVTKNFRIKETLMLNTWSIDYAAILFNRIELFAGPTANMIIASSSLSAANVSPKWARAYEYDNRLWGWLGFHAGLRF